MRRVWCVTAVVMALAVSSAAQARRPAKPRPRQGTTRTPEDTPSQPAQETQKPAVKAHKGGAATVTDIPKAVAAAQQACEAFDLDNCISLCNGLLTRAELTSQQQATVYAHLAASYAVLGDPTESERYYRLLLRLQPEFDLTGDTPPKILVVFRNVQTDEKRLRQAMLDAAKKRLREGIEVEVSAPGNATGGRPLDITANVKSAQGGVSAVALKFRKEAAEDFATQPMTRVADQTYAVKFPPDQTATDAPRKWEYYVVVEGEGGEPLHTKGSAQQPYEVAVAAGSVPGVPLWQQGRFWLISTPPVAAVLLGAVAMAVVVVGFSVATLWLYSIQPPRAALGTQRL
jgi:hypothetical protein